MSKPIFGRGSKIIKDHMTAWCLGKIWKLIGPIPAPVITTEADEFMLAQGLALSTFKHPETGEARPYIPVRSLQEELESLPRELCSLECIDFIKHLLIIDHNKRPNAVEALRHPFVKDLVL